MSTSAGRVESLLQEYVYQPLLPRHIRLLRLSRNPAELQIIHTSITSAPNYNAVSYAWNGQLRNESFVIGPCRLRVIQNIVTALPHLTRNASTQYLWIDGICINQDDEFEKEVQVPLMREIYILSRSCLVWLGDSTPVAEIAFNTMPRIIKKLETYEELSQVWEEEGISVLSKNIWEAPLWKGIVDIFSRLWFKRVWTFQEAVLPPEVLFLCGACFITLEDIQALAIPLLNHLTVLENYFPRTGVGKNFLFVGFLKMYRISQFRNSGKVSQKPLNTLRLLYFTNPWFVSNRLDKVYGVLGVCDRSLQQYITVDYSKSKANMSKDLVKWYIEYGEDLFFLNLATSTGMEQRPGTLGLPTWIPDFTDFSSHWGLCTIWQRFRAGMVDRKTFTDKVPQFIEGELHVKGFQVDEVSHIIPSLETQFQTQAEKCANIIEWENVCLDASMTLFVSSLDIVPEAHWTTIILAICDKHIKPILNDYLLLKAYIRSIASNKPLTLELEYRKEDFSMQIRRLHQALTVGRFYCTRDGRVGIGPKGTLPGDTICVFYNGFTPFVLRHFSDVVAERECDRWKFVGDSYTWGLMAGETFQEPRPQEETFILSSNSIIEHV
jgi:hypothetical protein